MSRKSLMAALVAATLLLALAGAAYIYLWSPMPRLPADPATAQRISFYALGDQGSGGLQQWEVARAMDKRAGQDGAIDFAVLLGDNFYTRDALSADSLAWQSRFERMYAGSYLSAIPFYAVLGNHDYDDAAEPVAQGGSMPAVEMEYSRKHLGSNRWRMPERYYTADFGRAGGRPLLRVVFLDTNQEDAGLVEQAAYLRRQMAMGDDGPVWKIVVGHHPFRTYGKHFGERAAANAILLAAMQEAHVDAYLSGHDHNQQFIAGDGEPLQIISGAGGSTGYAVSKHAPDLLFSTSAHGFAGIALDAASMRIDFYDAQASALASYTIARDCTAARASCLRVVSR